MPIQIDQMDTTIEITGRAAEPASAPSPERGPPTGATSRVDLRELVMQILADGLDQFARMRGL
jgi:hypothetical protein